MQQQHATDKQSHHGEFALCDALAHEEGGGLSIPHVHTSIAAGDGSHTAGSIDLTAPDGRPSAFAFMPV